MRIAAVVVGFSAGLILLGGTSPPTQPPQSEASARAAIAEIIAREKAAWERGDAAAFSADVTEDVVFTNVVGMFSVGKAPFQAQHEKIFATIYKGSTVSQSIAHIAFPTPDVAIVDTLAKLAGYKRLPPGVEAIDGTLQTRLEQVMVRRNGSWKIAAYHNVAVNAAAPQSPPE